MIRYFALTTIFLILGVAQATPSSIDRQATYYPDEKLASEQFFQNGQKVGVHRTWYPSGKLKSLVEYEKPGQPKVYKTWYESGQLAKVIVFENGKEVDTKIYRETGQIYLNRVVRNGRVYGLPGGKACARVNTR